MNFTVRKQPFSLIKETAIFNDYKKDFLTATLKPYKLKEEITIYNGKQELILKVISKSTLNLSQTFFVFNQKNNQLGTIKKDNINKKITVLGYVIPMQSNIKFETGGRSHVTI